MQVNTGFAADKKREKFSQAILPYSNAAGGAGSTTVGLSYPLGIELAPVGSLVVFAIACKPGTIVPTCPAECFFLGEQWGGPVSSGTDTGRARIVLFGRITDGSETGGLGAPIPGGNSAAACIVVFEKDLKSDWHVQTVSGDDLVGGVAYSFDAFSPLGVRPGDVVAFFSASNTDVVYSDLGVTCSDPAVVLNLSAPYGHITSSSTTTGQDCGVEAGCVAVTSGRANVIFNVSRVSATSTSNSPEGAMVFLRLRQVQRGSGNLPYSSGVRVYNPNFSSEPDYATLATGGLGWDGLRLDFEGAANFDLESVSGKLWFRFNADLSPIMVRRVEASPPWQSRREVGTEDILIFRLRTKSDVTIAKAEALFLQLHAGVPAVGGPYPSNHPNYYVGICGNDVQTNVPNTGLTSSKGQLIFVDNVNNIRFFLPVFIRELMIQEFEIIFHIVHESINTGFVKVFIDGVLVYSAFNITTVTTSDAQLGSESNVAPVPKMGVYHHSVNNAGDVAANAALNPPHLGYDFLIGPVVHASKHPSYHDYQSLKNADYDQYKYLRFRAKNI